jgi:Na+-driven multidrug efflux pump
MREMGHTFATMVASVIAILTNLVFNFLLIYPTRELTVLGATFTMWGAGLGVRGAAIATVLSRFVEMFIVLIYAHLHQGRYTFLKGAFRNGYVPLHLLKRIAITGSPLMVNEIAWSLGMTFINQCYSTRGMTALAALNITSTAWNLFCIVFFAMGNAVAIMVGQHLGRGDKQGARDTDTKLIFLDVICHIVLGAILAMLSGVIPNWFAVTDEAKRLASQTLIIAGAGLPIHAFLHATYFTIRSGGKTFITFLFDSVYTWCVPAVLAFVLSRYTQVDVVVMYFAIQFIDVIKLMIGLMMLRSDFWANDITAG